MRLLTHTKPNLKMPQFKVDEPLSIHLNEDPLLKNMNKSFCCGLIGKAGSGKTSLMVALIQTPKKLKKVFNKIYVFMPNSSRNSMKDNIFEILPEDQLFEGVSYEILSEVYENLLESTEKNEKSLLVFDDVQSYLKNKEVEVNLLHIIANRRHLRCSIFIVAQNYNKIPKNIRQSFTDMFLFNVGKEEYVNIYDENINLSKIDFQNVLSEYRTIKKTEQNSFIYIHDKDTFFINWNEIIEDDDNFKIN
jgi:ABC-type dipeptide/oligopeptide/nickel transport system ATPase component